MTDTGKEMDPARALRKWTWISARMERIGWIALGTVFIHLILFVSAYGLSLGRQTALILLGAPPVLLLLRMSLVVARLRETRRHLRLEREFTEAMRDPENVAAAMIPQSRFWMRSVLAQGARSTGTRPDIDAMTRPALRGQLYSAYEGLWKRMTPTGVRIEVGLLTVWVLLLASLSNTKVLVRDHAPLPALDWTVATYATIIVLSILTRRYWRWSVRCRELIARLPDFSSDWMLDRLERASEVTREKPYRRSEQIRELPWRKRTGQKP